VAKKTAAAMLIAAIGLDDCSGVIALPFRWRMLSSNITKS